jgi:hypothetical protein
MNNTRRAAILEKLAAPYSAGGGEPTIPGRMRPAHARRNLTQLKKAPLSGSGKIGVMARAGAVPGRISRGVKNLAFSKGLDGPRVRPSPMPARSKTNRYGVPLNKTAGPKHEGGGMTLRHSEQYYRGKRADRAAMAASRQSKRLVDSAASSDAIFKANRKNYMRESGNQAAGSLSNARYWKGQSRKNTASARQWRDKAKGFRKEKGQARFTMKMLNK